ncbi:flagellar biosynthetic protein FlhB [Litoreibacter ponti]|uniref:Flagellar biosynthetic protein FlhB n=1 Tax=Litoreibacter ponti TaxID=1510457 RepID=A0A2T6BNA7_9RHOB|nr:flagellar type III secretion system protein FlhB [Litoreibacter ponti]PTX57568.1 flagellar biosynthetic protein FlhB [Litoreibacter ponti]
MAEESDSAEKTHDPTPKKLLDARKKGTLPKSNDLSASAAYLGLILALAVTSVTGILEAAKAMQSLVARPFDYLSSSGDISGTETAYLVVSGVIGPIGPLFLIPAIAVLLCLFAQQAIVFAPSKLEPKLNKISPLASLKNKFGRSGLFEFAKSATKLLVVSILMVWFFFDRLDSLIMTSALNETQMVGVLSDKVFDFLILIFIMSLAIGAVDYLWQVADNLRKNRMTRKEVEDENKEAEGDPHHKQQRRQRGYEIAMNQMLAEVPSADVIIVNPTHYAVALRWDPLSGQPPICVAKGVDEIAARIREAASAARVPIHSDPPTARALYAKVGLGEVIWPEDYKAVAAAIRFAQSMIEKRISR